jgi:hypothetical protein
MIQARTREVDDLTLPQREARDFSWGMCCKEVHQLTANSAKKEVMTGR